uniref:Zgc:136870 n=1 Tax=Sphaeramia orbicularis TaxID=375764 RepID=A0A673C2T0_9TELE
MLLGQGRVFDTRGGGTSSSACAVSVGRQVTVVDAQGWGSCEELVPRDEKIELMTAMSMCGPGPHVVLLVIPLLDFTESERMAVERRMELLTSAVWRYTMVLFTFGDRLKRCGRSVDEHIKSGGPAMRWLMEKCRYRYHVMDNTPQEQVNELLSKVEDMMQENGGWHFSLHMYQRLEEEWSRREQELRDLLETETDVGRGRRRKEPTMGVNLSDLLLVSFRVMCFQPFNKLYGFLYD